MGKDGVQRRRVGGRLDGPCHNLVIMTYLVAGMASRRPSVTTWSCKFTRKQFEGVAGPPSRARHISCMGVGGVVSQG
jgi:hypothetical protein